LQVKNKQLGYNNIKQARIFFSQNRSDVER